MSDPGRSPHAGDPSADPELSGPGPVGDDVPFSNAVAGVGRELGADRISVFENVRDADGRLWMNLAAEWRREGVRGVFDEPSTKLHPYSPDFTRWIEVLGDRQVLTGAVAELPEPERRVLASEGTASVVAVPIFLADGWWGYLAADDCNGGRSWSASEIELLRAVAAGIAEDVSRQRRVSVEEIMGDRYRSIVEHAPVITYIDALDDGASTLFMSPQVEDVLGYGPDEWINDHDLWLRIVHPEDRARAVAENQRHNETGERFSLDYRIYRKDGRLIWIHDEARVVRDERGVPTFSLGVMLDITDRKRGDEKVAFLTYHDELTGLPSRAMLEEFLELSVSRASRHEASVAVLCVDIDDFRLVNDSLGRLAGDEVLNVVAGRLREALRETDLVARRSGDTFFLLLADLERDGDDVEAAVARAESAAQRILDSLSVPFRAGGTELYVSASIGISLFPQDGDEAGSLLRNAEAAMLESKKTGHAYVVSNRGALDSSAKLRFVTRLRKAVESQRWTLHYQPVLDLASGRMTGVEALIRWIEPNGTLVAPGDFIPVAEELGLIEAIGDWVVRELVYQSRAWHELDIDLTVSFNLSPRQFWQPELARGILSRIGEGGVDPSTVVVEITESSAMTDPDRAQAILEDLHAGGLRIAIDDFGTGYSSLARIRTMPVDILKIDRSFVSGVDVDPQNQSIVSAFLELSRGLGVTTLAEGIETERELAFLRDRGCVLGQGFHFSKAVPPEEIIALSYGGLPLRAGAVVDPR
ncbi:MAG TPA: EAL domain-containing protein [Actinomycetota bacterium]|nr:EAL domain-containing protein [Actinomycetota bacterium]